MLLGQQTKHLWAVGAQSPGQCINICMCIPHLKKNLHLISIMFAIYKCEKLANSLSPVFSAAFAFSGSGVFTINVRPLSVNTSINTAQRFTSYASFWLSHLLKERAREKAERTEEKGSKKMCECGRGDGRVSKCRTTTSTAAAARWMQTQSCGNCRKSSKTQQRHQKKPSGHQTITHFSSVSQILSLRLILNFTHRQSTQRITAEITMATVCHTILFLSFI